MSELARRYACVAPTDASDREADLLTKYELRVFSRNGEDGIIAEILRRIGTAHPYFAEIGIGDGRAGCCVALADVAGWPGAFVEADPARHGDLAAKYAGAAEIRTLAAEATAANIEGLLRHLGVPSELLVLCIGIGGADYWLWRAVSDYRPRLVVIGYNSALGATSRYVEPPERCDRWDGTDYFGASIAALRNLGATKGYELVHTDLSGTHAFFVRADLAAGRFADHDRVPLRGPNFDFRFRYLRDPQMRPYVDPVTLDD